jgi:predicted MFS family arabinose efflux permease
VILGLFLAIMTIPLHALILRRRPHDMGLLPDGEPLPISPIKQQNHDSTLKHALRGVAFWQLTASFAIAAIAAAAIRVHFIPFLVDAGFESSAAAFASGGIGLMQVAGRLVFAPLEMRYSSRTMVIGVFTLEALGMSLLLFTASWWTIGLFIVIFGMAYGAKTLARPAMLADLYGASHYGRISSVNAMFLTIANTAAPVGAGLLYDHFDSYQPIVWLILALSITSVAVMLLMKPQRAPSQEVTLDIAAG